MTLDDTCLPCKASFHDECQLAFTGELAAEEVCCCNGEYTLADHLASMVATERLVDPGGAGRGSAPTVDRPPKERGDSGYIHPDAWPSPANIGSLVDPESTGRKRQAKMFPISVGQVCEWARKEVVGVAPVTIIGCLNNPATDLHHGPDKNTLNNAKASWGIGDTENTHIICSDCHNWAHSVGDEFYPAYDRLLDQASPWLPTVELAPFDLSKEASFEQLVAEERRRDESRKRRGRNTRGRNSTARTGPDLTVADD